MPAFPAFKIVSDVLEPHVYTPYPSYTSRSYRRLWKGKHAPCVGPRDTEVDGNRLDRLRYYRPVPSGLCSQITMPVRTLLICPQDHQPPPTIGSHDSLHINPRICLDRWSRFNPAGYDEDHIDLDRDLDEDVLPRLDWDHMDWDTMQEQCYIRNQDRYEQRSAFPSKVFDLPTEDEKVNVDSTLYFPQQPNTTWWSPSQYHLRTGVVVHLNARPNWPVDTQQFLRSLILELSLHTGGEYEIILLVRSPHPDNTLFSNDNLYNTELRRSTPPEFRNITMLYNAALTSAWYPGTELSHPPDQESQAELQTLALLSLLRPDLEHIYHISHQVRYTSNFYPLLESLTSFAASQPRQGLQERNSHLYFPSLHHRYSTFVSLHTNVTSLPDPPSPCPGITPIGPDPPNTPADYPSYGITEPADLITLSPILSPSSLLTPSATPQIPALRPFNTTSIHGVSISTALLLTTTSSALTSYSKRLLRAIHHTQLTTNASMPGPMLGPSIARVHGLKAVVAPMPNWLDVATTPSDVYRDLEGGVLTASSQGGNETRGEGEVDARVGDGEKILRLRGESPRWSMGMSGTRGVSEFGNELYKRWMGYVSPLLFHLSHRFPLLFFGGEEGVDAEDRARDRGPGLFGWLADELTARAVGSRSQGKTVSPAYAAVSRPRGLSSVLSPYRLGIFRLGGQQGGEGSEVGREGMEVLEF